MKRKWSQAWCAPTADEKSFCSISPAQGVNASLSRRTLLGKMPRNCTGSHSGQLHCLPLSPPLQLAPQPCTVTPF